MSGVLIKRPASDPIGLARALVSQHPPESSSAAAEFVQQHPEEARVAVTAALETVAAHFDPARDESKVPDSLRPFV